MDRIELHARLAAEAYRVIDSAAQASARFQAIAAWIPTVTGVRSTEQGIGAYCVNAPGMVILVFRGTADIRDVGLDAEVMPAQFICDRCSALVHSGFRDAWEGLRPWVGSLEPFGHVLLSACGHSLGAAVATLAGMSLSADQVFTYGSPMVSYGRRFADAYDGAGPITTRVVHADDLVPQLPGGNYGHVGTELRVGDDGASVLEPSGLQVLADDIDGAALSAHHVGRYVSACAANAARRHLLDLTPTMPPRTTPCAS